MKITGGFCWNVLNGSQIKDTCFWLIVRLRYVVIGADMGRARISHHFASFCGRRRQWGVSAGAPVHQGARADLSRCCSSGETAAADEGGVRAVRGKVTTAQRIERSVCTGRRVG